MLKLQYTCQYLVDEKGTIAKSIKKAVDKKIRIRYVYCSTVSILETLIERWNRQGLGLYKYSIESTDEIFNNQSRPVNYMYISRNSNVSVIGWHGHQQHDYDYIEIKE